MKISVIGGGNVGASAALILAQMQLGDVYLFDIVEGLPTGKGLDIAQAGPVNRFGGLVCGTCDFNELRYSDIVVMTAGLPRKPGMSRMDLLTKNAEIVSSAMKHVAEKAPKSIVVVVSNPLDVMTYVAWKTTGFPKERVVGMAGVLDSTRFRHFIASELNVSPEDVHAMVLGGHGDSMVPLVRYSTVSGIPLAQLLPADKIQKMVDRTRNGGGEIVALLKTGSAYYAPAASAALMVESIVLDKKRLVPASTYLNGEFGLKDVFVGVPVVLGKKGVEKIVEIDLSAEEKEALAKSAADVKEGISDWQKSAR